MTNATRNRPLAVLLLVTVLSILLSGMASNAAAQDRSAYWKEFNTEITVNDDGSFHVVETQLVSFSGSFRTGNRVIPTDNVESIENVEVSVANSANEEPQPLTQVRRNNAETGTYQVYDGVTTLEIDYYFDRTSDRTEDRLIVIEYDVFGGIRDYPDETPPNQQLRWIAVSDDVVSSATVQSSTISITLPEDVAHEEVVYSPEDANHQGDTFTWTRTNLSDQFEVGVQFPRVTDATAPVWQSGDDRRREEAAAQADKDAVGGTAYLAAGLLLAVGGTLALAARWYTKGRDPQIGLVADIMAEPPDDLHPGAAGTLIDERTDTRDIVATLVDLGRRNIIHIDEKTTEGFFGFGGTTSYEIILIDPDAPREDYETELLSSIFASGLTKGASVPMQHANQRMQASASRIHKGFYKEVVDHGYFEEDPNKVRAKNSMMGIFAPIIAAIVWVVVGVVYGANSGWLWFMIFAAAFVFFIGTALAQAMVRKTVAGAEAAAKWNAFKRYLEDIEDRADLKESQDIYERYLPYAVAFGIEKGWVTKFESAGVPTPEWFGGGPVIIHTGGGGFGREGGGWATGGGWSTGGGPFSPGGGESGGMGFPDLQGSSDSAARGIGGASGSLLGMLGTAAKVISSSSGGGFGGGGGGGFSGGGGFGGGGGGGSSSFG